MTKCLNLERFGDNLLITLTDEGREALSDMESIENGEDILIRLLEYNLGNGWEIVRPEEVGALTDSLIISDDTRRDDDDGKLIECGRVYWHPNYMVENPIKSLLEAGRFVMKGTDGSSFNG